MEMCAKFQIFISAVKTKIKCNKCEITCTKVIKSTEGEINKKLLQLDI